MIILPRSMRRTRSTTYLHHRGTDVKPVLGRVRLQSREEVIVTSEEKEAPSCFGPSIQCDLVILELLYRVDT